jgi:molecular chaperone GrpE
MDLIQSGGSDVLKAILPILDDMQRATAASEKSDDINALREGERLVVQKFIDTLRQKKVVEIEALDCPFDENLHEAVARFAAGEEKKGKVIDVIERGYMLGDKVLRFAKVVVGE